MNSDFKKLLLVDRVFEEGGFGLEIFASNLAGNSTGTRRSLHWDDELVGEFVAIEPNGKITTHSGTISPVHVRKRGWCYVVTGCDDLPTPPYFLTERRDVSVAYEGRVVVESAESDSEEQPDDEFEGQGETEEFVLSNDHFGVLTSEDPEAADCYLRLFGCRRLPAAAGGQLLLAYAEFPDVTFHVKLIDLPDSVH